MTGLAAKRALLHVNESAGWVWCLGCELGVVVQARVRTGIGGLLVQVQVVDFSMRVRVRIRVRIRVRVRVRVRVWVRVTSVLVVFSIAAVTICASSNSVRALEFCLGFICSRTWARVRVGVRVRVRVMLGVHLLEDLGKRSTDAGSGDVARGARVARRRWKGCSGR